MNPFVAEIRIFAFNFPPTGWAFCNGQLLPILQNLALFSILGTFYGGDGLSTFALPNMQGSVPMHPGQGASLSLHELGETGGADTVTLLASEMPVHAHGLRAATNAALVATPSPTVSLARSRGFNGYQSVTNSNLVPMSGQAIAAAGGGLPHNNLQPYLTLNFCIALQGVFPPH